MIHLGAGWFSSGLFEEIGENEWEKTPLELRRCDCDCKVGGSVGCGVDGNVVCDINSYLIDSEANGVQVPSKALVFTTIFLHQTH